MGCAQSRVDNEESVTRCKERKILMKEAVIARNHFAAGHSGYAIALKNTGAALSDYGHGEADEALDNEQQQQPQQPIDFTPQPPPPPPMNLPPPPPPLPNFSPSPIKRAISMPTMPMKGRKMDGHLDAAAVIAEEDEEEVEDEEDDEEEDALEHRVEVNRKNAPREGAPKKVEGVIPPQEVTPPRTPEGHGNVAWDYFFMMDSMAGPDLEEEDTENVNLDPSLKNNMDPNLKNESMKFGGGKGNVDGGVGGGNVLDEIEPKTPIQVENEVKKGKQKIEHSVTAPPEFRRVVKTVSSVNLMKILNDIDDHFLKASETAQEVSKMLEATRLHYHSNFADNRGHIDHSARVMRVITWNRSFKGIPNGEGTKDDLDSEEYETHATVLDKLLAWEKKLYDEVKQGELMKIEYQRKVSTLNKQKKRNVTPETLEKTKAAVSHLHTRYIVDMQSMDSTVSEVNRLRDEQLYPKLVTLVDGMAKMWGSMCKHHDSQLKIVMELKSLEVDQAPRETTKHHHERTNQLHNIVLEWHEQFDRLVTYQKQYIQTLNSWLKLNLIPIESSLKEKISSPLRPQSPPIQALLHMWHDHLDKLPDELAKSAISSFAAVIKTILLHQEEEMKLREKYEETRKEYLRKNQGFEEWYHKYTQKRTPDEMDTERGEDANAKDPVFERQGQVDTVKKRLEEEIEAHQRHCLQVREKSLGSLKIRLPELFRAMSDYTHACVDAYEKLRYVTQSRKSNGGHT